MAHINNKKLNHFIIIRDKRDFDNVKYQEIIFCCPECLRSRAKCICMIKTNNLKQLRKKKKLTQAELAKIVGVSTRAIRGFEKAEYGASAETEQAICNALGVNTIFIHYKK